MRRCMVTEKYNEEHLSRLKRESSLLIKNSSDLVSILAKIFNCMTGVSAFLQQLKTFPLSTGMASRVPASRGSNAGAVPAALREGLVRSARAGQAALPSKSVDLRHLRKVLLQRSETIFGTTMQMNAQKQHCYDEHC